MAKFQLFFKTKKESGQLIIEAIIAIFIITISILVFVALLARATALNRVINDRYTAVYLAAEGIEVVKNIVDGNYIQGKAWNDIGINLVNHGEYELDYTSKALKISQIPYNPLKFDRTTGIYDYNIASVDSPFKRKITIDVISAGEIRVNSIVTWRTGGVNYEINLEDHFFDWRE